MPIDKIRIIGVWLRRYSLVENGTFELAADGELKFTPETKFIGCSILTSKSFSFGTTSAEINSSLGNRCPKYLLMNGGY